MGRIAEERLSAKEAEGVDGFERGKVRGGMVMHGILLLVTLPSHK